MDDFSGWRTSNYTGNNYENVVSGADIIDHMKNTINLLLLVILIFGLILGTYLTYRRHKGEKGLGKKIFKWNFIYIIIVFTLWLGYSFLFWYLHGPFADPQTISIEN